MWEITVISAACLFTLEAVIASTSYVDSTQCSDTSTSLICHGNKGMDLHLEGATQRLTEYETIEVSNYRNIDANHPQQAKKIYFHDSSYVLMSVSQFTSDVRIDSVGTVDLKVYDDVKTDDLYLTLNNVAIAFLHVVNRGVKRDIADERYKPLRSLAVYKSMIALNEISSSGNILMVESTVRGSWEKEITLVAREIQIISCKLMHLTRAKAEIINIDDSVVDTPHVRPNIETKELRVTGSILREFNATFLQQIKKTVDFSYFENNHIDGSVEILTRAAKDMVFFGNTFECKCNIQFFEFGTAGDNNFCKIGGEKVTVKEFKKRQMEDGLPSLARICK